jgi:TatD DNase family protein
MIIDVHMHADFLSENKLENLQRNKEVKFVVTNSVNLRSCEKNLEIAEKYSKIKLAAGLYPEKDLKLSDFDDFGRFVEEHKKEIIALGEIGLDLHETKDNFEIQKVIFRKQLELARKMKILAIIHTRKAEKEVLDILDGFKDLKVILHCFSGNFKLVKRGIEIGCYFSIPANITRSEHFQKMVKDIPHEKILTETDSPYLSPFIGHENEPALISESIKKISEIWKVSGDEVEKQIERNFNCLLKE